MSKIDFDLTKIKTFILILMEYFHVKQSHWQVTENPCALPIYTMVMQLI